MIRKLKRFFTKTKYKVKVVYVNQKENKKHGRLFPDKDNPDQGIFAR